jgi:hypothetical protein
MTLADGILDHNTTRGMAMRPVNPLQVTSVVGHSPDDPGEYVVTRLRKDGGKTSDGRQVNDRRGNRDDHQLTR